MKKTLMFLLLSLLSFSALFGCSSGVDSSTDTEAITTLSEGATQTPQEDNVAWYDFSVYEDRGIISDSKKVSVHLVSSDKCEVYEFTYDSDGCKVKGFIAIPLECTETETPFNCIVYNRGGNSNTGFVTGDEIAAMSAVSNRIVVASQYRGADGSEGKDEFGGKDLNDVLALIELCDKEFRFVNIENLCMVGVSRGGMMAYMAARADDRVKGVVAVSAVTDLVASYNEREDMQNILQAAIGGTPEELPEEYAKRSAINWADELDLPVYIIHSKNDEQVSHSQAKAMHDSLKEAGCEVTMRTHLDDVHGFHTEDVESIVQWIDQTLPKTN